jgi:hypothetical protein
METPELEKEIENTKERYYTLRRQWRKQTTGTYKFTHNSDGKKSNPYVTLSFFIIGIALLIVLANGSLTTSLQQMEHGGIELQNGHIYTSSNHDWVGYPYQMIQHNDGMGGTLFYSPIDGTYIGWMPYNMAATAPVGQVD